MLKKLNRAVEDNESGDSLKSKSESESDSSSSDSSSTSDSSDSSDSSSSSESSESSGDEGHYEFTNFNRLEMRPRNGMNVIIVNDVMRCIFGQHINIMRLRSLNSCIHQTAAFKEDKKLIFLPPTEIGDFSQPGAILKIKTEDRVVYACGYATMTRYLRALHHVVEPRGAYMNYHLSATELATVMKELKRRCVELEMDVTEDPRLNDELTTVGDVQRGEDEKTAAAATKPGKRKGYNALIPDSGKSEDEEDSEMSGFQDDDDNIVYDDDNDDDEDSVELDVLLFRTARADMLRPSTLESQTGERTKKTKSAGRLKNRKSPVLANVAALEDHERRMIRLRELLKAEREAYMNWITNKEIECNEIDASIARCRVPNYKFTAKKMQQINAPIKRVCREVLDTKATLSRNKFFAEDSE